MVAGLGGCDYEMEGGRKQRPKQQKQSLPTDSSEFPFRSLNLSMERSYQSTVVKVPERSQCQEEEDNEEDVRNEEQEEGEKETEEEQMSERQDNMETGSSGDGVSGPLLSVQRHDHIDMPLCPPSRCHRGRCGSCETVDDSTHWTLLEPCTFRENDICRYRFTSPPGRYECQESGLRWVCVVEVSLQYHYCSWENFEEQQNSLNCTEGGPLLDITVTAGHLDEIHLPHFICLGPDPSLSDRVKVLHVTDSGVSLERVCEVSRFHVKIPQPTFSPMGVVVQNLNRLRRRIRESFLTVHCHLLVFHGRKKAHLTLHIYLIPDNPALEKSVEEKEQKLGSVRIYKPSEPERSLQLKKKYKLTTSCTVTIIPQSIKLKNNRDPPANYFEVYVEQPKCIIGVSLIDEEESVWTTEIRKGDYSWREDPEADQSVPSSKDTAVRFVDDHRAELIQRVSLVEPIADALLQKSLISSEAYSKICAEKSSQKQMRTLYQFLDSGGPKVKFFFYTVLLRMDYPLVEDLGGV
ncbi:hypothetical protein AGOR_G00153030 [Albula goreensis]|uniref:Uncharacterized protein n=1 Tax=Albula goreensis TaxID=1534307 RepID=A0A8T3D349_9TELE|nr:hypothetical protein AGOR_G00153030 [Albula goreensis]